MPRTLPAGTAAFMAARGAMFVPIVLLDIVTIDGTQYYWSDYEGIYPTRATGLSQFYNGWIKSGCNFTCTRDTTSNAGDLTLQNLSGNTIDRDVAKALKGHEFEGAYAITRLWLPLLDASIHEFHCSLSEQNPKEDEVAMRELQLFDPTQYVIAGDVEVEQCTFRFKSLQCGSTGSATGCPKRFIDCKDASRAAQERYPAILTTVPTTIFIPPVALLPKGGVNPPSFGGGGPFRPMQ
jgi:hypothetical protein